MSDTSTPSLADYITVEEAAKIAPGSPALQTVYRWISHGVPVKGGEPRKLQSRHIGKKVLTTAAWIEEFINGSEPTDVKSHQSGKPRKKKRELVTK